MEEVINVGMNRINKTPAAVKVTANGSLKGNKKSKHASESVARFIFLICAVVAILAVCSITIYMFIKGTESLKSVGIADLLFKTVWAPTATPPAYGIYICGKVFKWLKKMGGLEAMKKKNEEKERLSKLRDKSAENKIDMYV